MGNLYNSSVYHITARNVLEKSINPPVNLTIDADPVEFVWQIARDTHGNTNVWNKNTNMFIREVGIFCNFADGLVFQTALNGFEIQLFYAPVYKSAALAGNATFDTTALKNVTGVGDSFSTDFIKHDIILDANDYPYLVAETPLVDNSLDVTDYIRADSGGDYYKASFNFTLPVALLTDIRQLNTMYTLNKYVDVASQIALISPTLQTPDLALLIVDLHAVNTDEDISFLTKSVSTDFVGDPVIFDVILGVEFTDA